MQFVTKLLLCTILIGASVWPNAAFATTEEIQDDSPLNVELEDTTLTPAPAPKDPNVEWESVDASINATAQKFSDVGPTHWARTEIYHLSELGIINGYNDGEFRSNLDIKRGQAANLFTNALKLERVAYKPIFSDVSEKSSFAIGALATANANIFGGKGDGTFGTADVLTREQLASTLVRAFKLEDTGKDMTFNDWDKISPSHQQNVKILAQHGITGGNEQGNYNPKATVSRATFAIMLHRALVKSGQLKSKAVNITAATASPNFRTNNTAVHSVQITKDEHPLYIRSASTIAFIGSTEKRYDLGHDAIYNYAIGSKQAIFTLTIRTLNNGSKWVFTTLKNNGKQKVSVDVYEKVDNVEKNRLVRYDRYPIKAGSPSSESYDLATAPTGLLQLSSNSEHVLDRVIGQAYRSRALSQSYRSGGQSHMRELYSETENFSYIALDKDFYSFYTLSSQGSDIVDSWYMEANELLFKSDRNMNNWMHESAVNFKKRNKWYTSQGPYSKMAVTTEPMPKSKRGYGRNLLLVKEDRALELLTTQGDKYFESVVMNSFINLELFKGDDSYWYTEVTSTYLKNLYGITAPFVDTRFNEQIALFYLRGTEQLGMKKDTQPLRNYADLLLKQVNSGNVIRVNSNAYYLPDYYPRYQTVKTHTSMNHVLGGVSILLHAYEEFGETKYLNAARSVMNAISVHKKQWIRSNGDIWYKIDRNKKFSGTDYVHLTLEDLTYVYSLWSKVDSQYLPLLESMIASKANYLSTNKLGYTPKIKNNLTQIDLLKYLP